MNTRRNFVKNTLLASGAATFFPYNQNLFAGTSSSAKTKTRFIFMTRSNGLRPHLLASPGFSKDLMEKENQKQAFNVSLDKYALPEWMSVLENHKNNLSVVQGLSNTFAVGHRGNMKCLGMFNQGNLPWATVDVELGRLNPSPFQHIEVQIADQKRGINEGFAVVSKGKRNFAYSDPQTAYNELFKTATKDTALKSQINADAMVLEYVHENLANQTVHPSEPELQKINNYKSTISDIKRRNKVLNGMSERILQNIPKIDDRYFDVNATLAEQHQAYTEIILGALKAGLTNSVLFTLDTLQDPYTGLPEQKQDPIHLHDIGHGKTYLGTDPKMVRTWIRKHHMRMINRLVEELKKTPEDSGSMFDNTVIFYQPDGGEAHHGKGVEHPVLILAGNNTKINFLGNYIRLPYYGKAGHKTLGNWYTTLLNNHGNSIHHYGMEDLSLRRMGITDQKGAINEFLV